MKTLFIAALHNMGLRGSLGRGIRLPYDLILTNSRDQIKGLLSAEFESLVGTIETKYLRANSAIYNISDQPNDLAAKHDERVLLLNQQLGNVLMFLTALWLVKDNSVSIQLGFLEYRHGMQIGVTSNIRAVRFSKADGSIVDTEFTDSEARSARDLQSKLFETAIRDDESRGYVMPDYYSRLARVFYFTQVARHTSNLGEKIAGYMTCFEALFCTDSAEIAHKLSERVAFFLAENPTERANVFGNVKTAYTI